MKSNAEIISNYLAKNTKSFCLEGRIEIIGNTVKCYSLDFLSADIEKIQSITKPLGMSFKIYTEQMYDHCTLLIF